MSGNKVQLLPELREERNHFLFLNDNSDKWELNSKLHVYDGDCNR